MFATSRSLVGWLLLLGATACQPISPPQASEPTPAPEPASEPVEVSRTNVFLNGAGATFPAPIYQRWFNEFGRDRPEIQINYQPIGSGAGIQQMLAETVDFGGSDVAMSDEEMARVERGVILIPMTAGSVAIAYNLPGVESGLRLSRSLLADIFLGKVTRWNDARIVALNGDRELPDLPITLVHRSDASGTTAVLTSHLSAISSEWQERIGAGLSVQWVAGVGIKSNSGVSAQIQQAEGTIGYVEYSYAQQLGLSVVALENRAGNYVEPSVETATEALKQIDLPEDLRGFAPDPEGENAYPIVTYSWLLVYDRYPEEPEKLEALKEVIRWSITEGQKISPDLGYVPLPPEVVAKVSQVVAEMDAQ